MRCGMLNRMLLVLTILLLCYTLAAGSIRGTGIAQYGQSMNNGCVPVLFETPNPNLPISWV